MFFTNGNCSFIKYTSLLICLFDLKFLLSSTLQKFRNILSYVKEGNCSKLWYTVHQGWLWRHIDEKLFIPYYNHRHIIQLCRIVQVFIYKQGDKKEVAKEGMPHFLNKKNLCFFFHYSCHPRYIPKRKINLTHFPLFITMLHVCSCMKYDV